MKRNILDKMALTLGVGILLASIFASSCRDWITPEAMDYYTPPSDEYKENLKNYFRSPHKVMFGWFGNWAGSGGATKQYSLMGLPDSVDFVSLWLMLGKLTPEQQKDLKEFQERGSRAVYCFTSNEIGKFATPEGEDLAKFWGYEDGTEESYIKASVKYAKAIADSCEKYNVDGFDIDLELTGSLINFSHPERLDTFMMTLRHEFDKKGRMLVADIPAGWNNYYTILTPRVIRNLDYIIWQSYDIAHSHSMLDNMFLRLQDYFTGEEGLWEAVVRKSIITATFERAWDKPKFKGLTNYESSFGIEHAGIGAYHIEYDFPGNPDYAMVRSGISTQNPPILK